jgi:hypothetical protein
MTIIIKILTLKENVMNKEEFKAKGKDALNILRELIKKGNITRIKIKDKKNNTILDIPATIIAVGTLYAPMFAGAAFVLALMNSCTIEIEKRHKEDE